MSIKFDSNKPRMELIPSKAMLEIAKVLSYGADKYAVDNWRKPGFDWTRLHGSMQRHLHAWNSGEDNDPETGLSHMAHAACNALMLLESIISGHGRDDRFKSADGLLEHLVKKYEEELDGLTEDPGEWVSDKQPTR